MYIIKKPDRRRKEKRKIQDINIIGFLMPTRNKKIKIKDSVVTNIVIIDKKLANPLVVKKVSKLYKKLIAILTELLVSDEESGDIYREVLNQIEKFRLMVKNEYRNFLTRKELEHMSKQLVILQKELNNRILEIHNSYMEMLNKENGRGR